VSDRGYSGRGVGWEWRQSWFLLFFLTVVLYWVPLLYMGLRVLHFRWMFYSLLYAGPAALYGVTVWQAPLLNASIQDFAGVQNYIFRSMVAVGVAAFIHTMTARTEFLLRLADTAAEGEEMATRVQMRSAATQTQPGRVPPPPPKVVFDLNTATEAELAMLPGMNRQMARQAIDVRKMQGGFGSFTQFADQLAITGEMRERLRVHFDDHPDAVPPPEDASFRVLADGRRVLELNWSTPEALAALPGFGPDLARRAVTLRDGDGPFKSLEDFRYRLGLKMDAMIKIEPYVSVTSMSTVPGGGTRPKHAGRIVDA